MCGQALAVGRNCLLQGRGEQGPVFVQSLSRSRGDKGASCTLGSALPGSVQAVITFTDTPDTAFAECACFSSTFSACFWVFFHLCLLKLLRPPQQAAPGRQEAAAVLRSHRDLLQMSGSERLGKQHAASPARRGQ